MAAKGGYSDVIALLLEETPNVNAVDQVDILFNTKCYTYINATKVFSHKT